MTSEVKTSLVAGNTKAATFRARCFLLTFNKIDKAPEIIIHFKNLKMCDYGVASLEKAPTTGHEHIHLYVHLNQMYKIPKKVLDSHVHIDICKGSPKQNIDYVKKEGDIIDEWGEEPKQGLKNSVKELKEINNPDDLDWKQYNTWKKIHEHDEIDVEDLHKDVKVYYIVGPSGIGKTEKMKQIIRDNKQIYGTKLSNAKYENGFWSGVGSNRNILVYDDFRDTHMKASEFINLIDYNTHTMNIKGGNVNNNYKLIIITSIQHPKNIYKNLDDEPRKQWLRRMDIIDMTPNYDDDEIDVEDL